MVKINSVKHVSEKVTRIKEGAFGKKAKTIEEANINLLNFLIKEKRELAPLKGKAHKIGKNFKQDITTNKVKKQAAFRGFNKKK